MMKKPENNDPNFFAELEGDAVPFAAAPRLLKKPAHVPMCEKRYYPPGAAFLLKVCTKDKDHEGGCGKGEREL